VVTADAWLLRAGDGTPTDAPATLVRQSIEIPRLRDGDVLVEPLFGCWEGNMEHALRRSPIDVCRARGEPSVVLGNAGTVRVLACGRAVTLVEPGQFALVFGAASTDRWGYMTRALGYDAPGTMGCLATRVALPQQCLIPIPDSTSHSLNRWAAFSLRSITAWSNWQLAYPVFRIQVPDEAMASPNVWGWGGGVALAELDLARRHGCTSFMLSSTPTRLGIIAAAGITAVDRRQFGDLQFDQARFADDEAYRTRYQRAERDFLDTVRDATAGAMAQIFVDMIGAPVHRLTAKALGREGVLTSSGWKAGMKVTNVRATDCVARRQYVHTHYARYDQGIAAVEYAEKNDWLPMADSRVYEFDDIPELAENYRDGRFDFYPCYSVNPV
jgi:NADPH:quinone reductase-like Zn-dependent oxidoreductase